MSGNTHCAEHFHSARTTPPEQPIHQANFRSSMGQTYFEAPPEQQGNTIHGLPEQYIISKLCAGGHCCCRQRYLSGPPICAMRKCLQQKFQQDEGAIGVRSFCGGKKKDVVQKIQPRKLCKLTLNQMHVVVFSESVFHLENLLYPPDISMNACLCIVFCLLAPCWSPGH